VGTEEDLDALRRLDVRTEEGREYLRSRLRLKNGTVVGAAVDRVREARLDGFEDLLHKAWSTLCERPVKRDPGCRGKLAIVRALDAAGELDDTLFLQGARLRQLEPSWGAPSDTAGAVRVQSLFALLRLGHAELPGLLADQLADPVPNVRSEAIRAAAAVGGSLGAALLRLKVRVGDEDISVRGDALAGLCEVSAQAGLQIAREWLNDRDPAVRELAALALGQTRLPQAVPLLRDAAERCIDPHERRALWVALGTLRLEPARDALLDQLDGPDPDAILEALAPYRFDRRTVLLALDRAPRSLHEAVRRALDPEGG